MNTLTPQMFDDTAMIFCLDSLGLIGLTGEDTQTFIQGQFTNDSELITETRSQLAGYCTPKGRLLASLLLWKTSEGFCAQLDGGISASVQKRLGMYVLRSKVKIADASTQFARLGLAGQPCVQVLQNLPGVDIVPQQAMATVQTNEFTIIRLHGDVPRFELIASPENLVDLREQLKQSCVEAEIQLWQWLEIQAGIAQIGPETQEKFIPQMVNLDVLEGVSFKKGCYTGQEIVARTHYLGKIKRRTHLAHVDASVMPKPGDPLVVGASAEPVGMVVNVAPSPHGGFDMLVELRLESVAAEIIQLAGAPHPVLQLMQLPYTF